MNGGGCRSPVEGLAGQFSNIVNSCDLLGGVYLVIDLPTFGADLGRPPPPPPSGRLRAYSIRPSIVGVSQLWTRFDQFSDKVDQVGQIQARSGQSQMGFDHICCFRPTFDSHGPAVKPTLGRCRPTLGRCWPTLVGADHIGVRLHQIKHWFGFDPFGVLSTEFWAGPTTSGAVSIRTSAVPAARTPLDPACWRHTVALSPLSYYTCTGLVPHL